MGARLRRGLRWVEHALFLAGALGLASVYVTWKEAVFSEIRARGQVEQLLATRTLPGDEGRPDEGQSAGLADPLLGYLAVPRVSLSTAVLDGADARTLAVAAGHLPETPLPWEEGNSAVAGHRDTFFRALEGLRVGDEIEWLTAHGAFRYRVLRLLVVGPDEVWVLAPWDRVRLTLVTCYPFTYVGSSPRRFIVHAELIADR